MKLRIKESWLSHSFKTLIKQRAVILQLSSSEESWNNKAFFHQRKSFSSFWLESTLTVETLEKLIIWTSVLILTDLKISLNHTLQRIQWTKTAFHLAHWEMLVTHTLKDLLWIWTSFKIDFHQRELRSKTTQVMLRPDCKLKLLWKESELKSSSLTTTN